MSVPRTKWLAALAVALFTTTQAPALTPYDPVPVLGPPIPGPGVSTPRDVYGKEYSHDFDFSVFAPAIPDPQQIIAWDGQGGTADTIDYTGTRPGWTPDQEIDAIANHRDALFYQVRGNYQGGIADEAHLNFTHDDMVAGYVPSPTGGPPVLTGFTIPSAGPVTLSNGNVIGGAGEISVEEAIAFGAAPSTQYTWATQPEINDMPFPVDVDGHEQWGPEPRGPGDDGLPVIGDSDKYSLDFDFPSGVSVWNGSGTPYIGLPTITAAVTSLLGAVPPTAFSFYDDTQGLQAINLDALMVMDVIEDPEVFHEDISAPPTGEELFDQNGEPIDPADPDGNVRGDSIIFSIRQIVNPADPDGYYATGSELFVLDPIAALFGMPAVRFLDHGGHTWDHAYALSDLLVFDEQQGGFAAIDVNGIEAVGEEPHDPGPGPCPGDADGDGDVDGDDLIAVQTNFGNTSPPFPLPLLGDADYDGDVDGDDLIAVQTNFGKVLAVSVPEPAAACMLVACLASMAVMRWRLG